jgi:hypothetical protein
MESRCMLSSKKSGKSDEGARAIAIATPASYEELVAFARAQHLPAAALARAAHPHST